jgi:hypothetical protein
MLADALTLAIGYLLFGLVFALLLRGGPAEDRVEDLLASLLIPPLFLLIAALVLGRVLWLRGLEAESRLRNWAR